MLENYDRCWLSGNKYSIKETISLTSFFQLQSNCPRRCHDHTRDLNFILWLVLIWDCSSFMTTSIVTSRKKVHVIFRSCIFCYWGDRAWATLLNLDHVDVTSSKWYSMRHMKRYSFLNGNVGSACSGFLYHMPPRNVNLRCWKVVYPLRRGSFLNKLLVCRFNMPPTHMGRD